MTASWPFSLPQAFQEGHVTCTPQTNILQTTNDQGRPKFRRMFSSICEEVVGDLLMTAAQVQTFKQFMLDQGVTQWQWYNPSTSTPDFTVPALMQFTAKQPQYKHLSTGGNIWTVTITVMMVPFNG